MKTTYTEVERYGKLVATASVATDAEKVERRALQAAMVADGLTIKKVKDCIVIVDEAIETVIRKFKIG